MKRIRVIVKYPDEPVGHPEFIENTLKDFQILVDGYIETITISPDLVIICNENGRMLGLPHNCDLFGHRLVGTLVFAGVRGDKFASFPGTLNDYKRRILGGDL